MRALACLVFASATLAAQQGPPPEARKLLEERHREGRLKAGDPAPDFTLKRLHSEKTVRLSEFQGKKPVTLVFGSFT